MNWIYDIQKAIRFIEDKLLEDISIDDVSSHIHSSTDYFQRTFNIVTGISISEYIRNRRLTLAADELKNTQAKIIDAAMKYNYDTPDSFTKAFTRFHGVTPSAAKTLSKNLKHFHPLTIDVYIKGGFGMSRKVIPNIPEVENYGNEVNYLLKCVRSGTCRHGGGSGQVGVVCIQRNGQPLCLDARCVGTQLYRHGEH